VIVGLDRSGIVTARVTAASDSCGLSADRFVRNGAGTEIGHAGVTTTRGGTMSEANKELVRRHFEEIWNRKNLAVTDELLAEHWATREDLVAMLQLGVVQPPGRPPS
jgi:hypothetical protein